MGFWISLNEETFSEGPYDTREEAIAAGPDCFGSLTPGCVFFSGEEVAFDLGRTCPVAESVIEEAQELAYDECGEVAQDWLDDVTPEQVEDLRESLRTAWLSWLQKHKLEPTWFSVDNIESHEVCELEEPAS